MNPARIASPLGRPDGNVLEVRLGRAEPACCCTRLVEAGVDPAGSPVYPLRQGIHVGALQLLQLAIFQNQPWKLMPHCGELFQYVGVGGGAGLRLLQHRKLLLLEQNAGKLPR